MASAGTSILNLDDLIPPQKTVSFKGETHPIVPLSMGSYLKLLQTKRQLMKQSNGVEDEAVQVEQAVMMLELAIPTLSNTLRELPVPAVIRLTEVIEEALDLGKKGEGAGSSDTGESISS